MTNTSRNDAPEVGDFTAGDVVVVQFPFAERAGGKARPAVVISSSMFHQQRGDVILLAVTSQLSRALPFEPILEDWADAGLEKPSSLKAAITTVHRSQILRHLGRLSVRDRRKIAGLLGAILHPLRTTNTRK